MDRITELLSLAWGSSIIKLVILAVVMDTCFCCIRAIKEHEFNSCFGIDGAIRKISMVASGWWYADTKTTYYKSCWQIINGHKYYFNPDGYALIGWQEIDRKWYYY